MRNILAVIIITAGMTFCFAGAAKADNSELRAQRNQLKVQQKREWSALKTQQKNVKNSWKSVRVTPAAKSQAKHQMARDSRNLKLQQRDTMQDLKDRQRSLKDMQRAYNQ